MELKTVQVDVVSAIHRLTSNPGQPSFFSTKYDGDLFFRDTLEVRSWLIGFSSVKSL